MSRITKNVTALDVTTGSTSGVFDVSMAKKISIQCVNTESTFGVVTFTAQISNDNKNFVSYNRFTTNVLPGSAPITTIPYTSSLKLSSVTVSGIMFVRPEDQFSYIKIAAAKSNKTAVSTGKIKAIIQTID